MSDQQTTPSVNTPDWMTPEQAQALESGAQSARVEVDTAVAEDRRISHQAIATFAPPAYLTNDYDPTYIPAVRTSGQFVVTDDAALALAAAYRNPAKCPRCIDCGEPIVAGGWAKGSGLHAWCHLKREGLAR
jgi:hypothetical protein